jgi:ribosomal-protein-alanine N-acetyltransferase
VPAHAGRDVRRTVPSGALRAPALFRLNPDPDPARLAALDARIFAEPMDAAAYADLRALPAVGAWVLEDAAGEAMGLLCFQRVADEAEVYRFGVVPERRRGGLGLSLLRRWLADLRALGVHHVHLDVRASNAAARRLYEQVGFTENGRRRAYYSAPVEDAVLYTLEQ